MLALPKPWRPRAAVALAVAQGRLIFKNSKDILIAV